MKRIILLGATGSVGTGACDVVRTHPGEFRVVALAARTNRAAAEALSLEFGARAYVGEDAALRAVEENDADIVLVATVGLSGLAPTLAAIEKGIPVALATKEVLVAAGALVMSRAGEKGVPIIPVDSEHARGRKACRSSPWTASIARYSSVCSLSAVAGRPPYRTPVGADAAPCRG